MSSGFGGIGHIRSKFLLGISLVLAVPFLMSTFAANVTVGTGSLEFGQGSQQAIACDPLVYVALGEEWFSSPTEADGSAGFFRVKAVTVSNLDIDSCRDKKLRVRLISTSGGELTLGPLPEITVLQIVVPNVDGQISSGDPTYLQLAYLDGDGRLVSAGMTAAVSLNISGTSIYDGSDLSTSSADVTFYLDPSRSLVNIDGQLVGRTTVETVNNPRRG